MIEQLPLFEYKFMRAGGGDEGAAHCTYCPKRPGEACPDRCAKNYEKLQEERAADGVIVNDEPLNHA